MFSTLPNRFHWGEFMRYPLTERFDHWQWNRCLVYLAVIEGGVVQRRHQSRDVTDDDVGSTSYERHEPGSKRVHTPRWQSVAARSSTERVSALRRWNMETNWMEDSWRILACTIFFLSFYVFVAVFFLSVCASFVICFTILKVVCFFYA